MSSYNFLINKWPIISSWLVAANVSINMYLIITSSLWVNFTNLK